MSIDACRVVEFPKITDSRGALSFIESGRQIPFDIKRVYYLYDIAGGAARAGHGHRALQQVIVAVSGSFDILLDDGFKKMTFHLNRSYQGLYVAPMIWREIDNFSSGAVCLALASEFYDESDYYRNYDHFIAVARSAG